MCVCVIQIKVHQLYIVTAIVSTNNLYIHTYGDLLFDVCTVLCVYLVIVVVVVVMLGSQCEVDS